jgi:hypothetical protein
MVALIVGVSDTGADDGRAARFRLRLKVEQLAASRQPTRHVHAHP